MAKRFADTEIWNKDWFLDLTIKQKLLVKFLFDNCDCAGVYEISMRNLKNCFGEEITKEDFKSLKQIKFISDNKIFIEDFIDFQYLSSDKPYLNPNNKAHIGVIRRLIKNNIDHTKYLSPLNGASKPLQRGTGIGIGVGVGNGIGKGKEEGVQGGEEEQTLAQVETDKEDPISPDIFLVNNSAYFRAYTELCPNLLPLTFERRNKDFLSLLAQFRHEIDDDVGKFRQLCQKANSLKVIADNKLDFKMVLNNYVGILNGKYDKKTSLGEEMSPDNFFKGVAINDQG